MAFISEKISTEEDKKYFEAFGFSNILNKAAKAYWWAIDRDKSIFLFPRGGGSFEIPLNYGLCVDGELIEIEVKKITSGSRNTNDLEIHWAIDRVVVPKRLLDKNYTKEELSALITEAFHGLGDTGIPYAEISKITVENTAELIIA